MATKSIGTGIGRDYASIHMWQSYLNGLGSLAEPEIGEIYNDGEITHSTSTTIGAGVTTSAANNITLRAAADHSYLDNVGPSDALRYDTTKGACVELNSNYVDLNLSTGAHVTIQGLQYQNNSGVKAIFPLGSSKHLLQDCLCESTVDVSNFSVSNGGKIHNSYAICAWSSGAPRGFNVAYGGYVDSSTAVRPTDLATLGTGFIRGGGGSTNVNNCVAVGAFSSCFSGAPITGDYNASSDATAPGANSVATQNLAAASQFVGVTSADLDLHVKSGAGIVNAGATALTADAWGTVRPRDMQDDIGAEEYVAASSDVAFSLPGGVLQLSDLAPTVTVSNSPYAQVPQGGVALYSVASERTLATRREAPGGEAVVDGKTSAVAASADGVAEVPQGDLLTIGSAPVSIVDSTREVSVSLGGLQINTTQEADGAQFDGSTTYLSRGGDLTGGGTSFQQFFASIWLGKPYTSGASSDYVFRSTDSSGAALLYPTSPARLRLLLRTTGGATKVAVDIPEETLVEEWNHIMWSLTTATGDTASDQQVYVNGVSQDSSVVQSFNAGDFAFTGADWNVGRFSSSFNTWPGGMADLYVVVGDRYDLDIEANRKLFFDGGWVPLNDGLKSAIIRLEGSLADWHTNKGTGGGFTENGTLAATLTVPALAPPTARIDTGAIPPSADLLLSTAAATAAKTKHYVALSDRGNLTISSDASGVAPGDSHNRVIPATDLLLTEVAAAIGYTTSEDVLVPVGALIHDSTAPAPYVLANITMLSGSLTLSTFIPSVNGTLMVPMSTGSLILNGEAPIPYVSADLKMLVGELAVLSAIPSIIFDTTIDIEVNLAGLSFDRFAPAAIVHGWVTAHGDTGTWVAVSPTSTAWLDAIS